MADREITLPEEIIYGDVPMTRKDANMSKKLPPKETMTMADVAEDFLPAEYRYLRDLSPEQQSKELLRLQEQWIRQEPKAPVKKDDGVRDVIASDAYGQGVVMPKENYPEFQRKVKMQEAEQELQRQQLPWELLMGLGGGLAGISAGKDFGRNPYMEGRPTTTMSMPSVSPRAAAALTALAAVAKPEVAEAARIPIDRLEYQAPTAVEPSKFLSTSAPKGLSTFAKPLQGPREARVITSGAGEGSAFDLVDSLLGDYARWNINKKMEPREYIRSRLIQAGYNPKPETMDKAMQELEPLIETAIAKLPEYAKAEEADRSLRLAEMSDERVAKEWDTRDAPRTIRGYSHPKLKEKVLKALEELGIEPTAGGKGIDFYNQLKEAWKAKLEAAQKALQDLEQQGKERETTRKQQRRR